MFQDVSTHRIASEPSGDIVSGGFLSVESYADSLMDELFEDIDKILEGGSQLPSQPVQPDVVALQPIAVPQLALPPAIARNLRDLALKPRGGPIERVLKERTPSQPPSQATTVKTSKEGHWLGNFWSPGHLMDKLLLVATCTSLIFALFLWLVSQGKMQLLPLGSTPDRLAPTTPVDPDSQFAEYMQKALAAVDEQAEARQRVASVPSAPIQTNNLPTVTIPKQVGAAPQANTNVLERVYIPVYQKPAGQVVLPGIPSPSPVATVTAAPALPAIAHTLVGLLDLGDSSAALFEIRGSTKRIKVGEAIGSSGWLLVAVANQEAIIRRNGEVRSIYVGQQI